MAIVETVRELLVALARRYAFREVAALLGLGAGGMDLSMFEAAQVQQLCSYGQRLLDMDAEDLASPDAALGATIDTSIADQVSGDAVPAYLVARGAACRIPQIPGEQPRGAMGS